MPWAIELSGEHATLPRAEARALVEQAGCQPVEADLHRVLLAEGSLDAQALAERLALSWRIVDARARTAVTVDAVTAAADAVALDGERFAVRCSRLDADLDPELGPRIEHALGDALQPRGTVDLDDPERVVRVLLDAEAVVGFEAARVDRSAYQRRHVEARPYFHPISLHPRLARALVNLARIGPGERLWDPFAGTGGIALEAALVDAETVASDIDPDMVDGTRATLDHFGVAAQLATGDVAEVGAGLAPLDAIVTDPPYGRASSTNKEDVGALYDRFLATASDLLEPGRRLVTILPDPAEAKRAPDELVRREHHEWYVHGTLTRHVFVFERS